MSAKQVMMRWAFSLAAVVVCAGCVPAAATLEELYYYPEEIWGEWIRVDTGATWRFGSNWSVTDGIGDSAVFEKQSGNVLKITEPGKTAIYLFASRLPTASFSGAIAGMDSRASSGRAIGGIGGMQVIISNANDRKNEVVTQTDAGGNYTAAGIVAGDDYEITVEEETTRVTVNTDGDDVGTITIVPDGVNFKTTLERRGESADQDMTRLWVGGLYYFNIVIENTGDEDCLAPTYRLAPETGVIMPSTDEWGELTTIEPGKSKKIPVEIYCFSVDGESENKKIDITIVSTLDRRSWNDSVSLKFNLKYVYLNIRSDGGSISNPVSGVVIVPGAKAYSFTTARSSSSVYAIIPRYAAQDYLVVFSGASADGETYYSFSISEDKAEDAPDLSGFTDKTAGENNDSEVDAQRISNPAAGFRAYLHKNDIDFYKIRF